MRPFSEKVRALPAGWLIPIAILFILSFPPLIGDEIVEILCGVIYGLWIGFGVVAAGTYFGQSKFKNRSKINPHNLLTRSSRMLVFIQVCTAWQGFQTRKNEFELRGYGAHGPRRWFTRKHHNLFLSSTQTNASTQLLCVIRLSVIPPPMSTAVFSTCDVKFWHFLLSTLLCLPRQIFLVYLGTLIVKDQKQDNTIQTIVFAIVLAITLGLGIWLWRKMKAIKIVLLEEQEQRRRAKLAMTEGRDEEEGIEHEWSSSTNDLRNDGPGGLYDPVPPPYAPVPLGENASYYNRTGNEIPSNEYNSRRYE